MLLVKLKNKFSAESVKVFAVSINKQKTGYCIELAMVTDMDKLESAGFEPCFESLFLTTGEFVDLVLNIQNVG